MKKYIFAIFLLILTAVALAACDFIPQGLGNEPESPLTDGHTASPVTTSTPTTTVLSDGVPTLSRIAELIKDATPSVAESEITADYTAPAVTLTAELTFRHTATANTYSYRTDYLLTAAEALAAKSPVGSYSGRIEIAGSAVTDASAEITSGLLAEIGTISIRLPTLRRDLLTTCEITREGDLVTLTATAKDENLAILFDAAVTGISNVSFTMTLDAATGRPTSLTLGFTSDGGADVVSRTTYSYE